VRNKEAVRLLERIQSGVITLQSAGVTAPAGSGTKAVFVPGDRVMFGRRGG